MTATKFDMKVIRIPLNPMCICGREIPLALAKKALKSEQEIHCHPRTGGCGSKLAPAALLAPITVGDRCSRCRRSVPKLNPHRMDRQKWMVLDMMARLHKLGSGWIKVPQGRSLVVNGRAHEHRDGAPLGHVERHVGRLRWFGLVEWEERRSGLNRVTEAGYQFLAGHGTVPTIIYCREGVVEYETEAHVDVRAIKGVVLDKGYWDSYREVTATSAALEDRT